MKREKRKREERREEAATVQPLMSAFFAHASLAPCYVYGRSGRSEEIARARSHVSHAYERENGRSRVCATSLACSSVFLSCSQGVRQRE